MINVIRLVITVVFGFLWWWIYNRIGAGSISHDPRFVLAVSRVLLQGRRTAARMELGRLLRRIRRCWIATLVLMSRSSSSCSGVIFRPARLRAASC